MRRIKINRKDTDAINQAIKKAEEEGYKKGVEDQKKINIVSDEKIKEQQISIDNLQELIKIKDTYNRKIAITHDELKQTIMKRNEVITKQNKELTAYRHAALSPRQGRKPLKGKKNFASHLKSYDENFYE